MVRTLMTLPSRAPADEVGAVGPGEPGAVIPISERVLLQRHVDGDADAFGRLMKLYSTPIYGYLARTGVTGSERDDLFQEIFCRVHRAAGTHPPVGELKPWLFAIAVNTVRSHFRKTKVRSAVQLDDRPGAAAPAPTDGADRVVEAKQTAAWIEAQLDELPLEQREVLVLCCIEGIDQDAAARALDVPLNTVKTRLRRARLALAEAALRRDRRIEKEGAR